MTDEHILSCKPAAGLDQIGNECCEHVQDRKHRSQRCDDSALSCESRPDRIFGRDRCRRNKFSASSRLRDLNRLTMNIASTCRIENIAINDAMILPYYANLDRM